MRKKSLAFTLGEVLIALAVIGAIASLVLPQMILGQKSNQARSQFNTAYSLLGAAIARMDADNVSLKPASYSSKEDFYNVIKKYQKISHDCGTTGLCDPNPAYQDIDASGAFILNNGMLVIVENAPDDTEVDNSGAVIVTVDINGNRKMPNKRGYDVFTFQLVNGDIVPVGADDTFTQASCSRNSNASTAASMACSQEAATDADYFKKVYNNM